MNRYFITGTDTDCGKTYVTRLLMDLYPASMAIKPVASGYNGHGDIDNLLKDKNFSIDALNPWRFSAPVSPHIAAEQEGKTIEMQELAEFCLNFKAEGIETLLIEGAGGLMVPLNYRETWMDFLKLTQIPVILVVGMKLGCINHALLTEMALISNGIRCHGWIANCLDPKMLALTENINTLKLHLSSPLLTVVSHNA